MEHKIPATVARLAAANFLAQAADLAQQAAQADDDTTPYEFATLTSDDIPNLIDQARTARVAAWRADGLTWEKIGERLGVTHQAARQRLVPLINALVDDGVIELT